MGNVTLSLVVLKTRRVDDLRRFYDTLGIPLSPEQHGNGPAHFAGRVGDVVFEVYPLAAHDPSADSTTRLGFAVENLGEVVQAVRSLGAPVVSAPRPTPWGVRAVVRDPDGRAIELYERAVPPIATAIPTTA